MSKYLILAAILVFNLSCSQSNGEGDGTQTIYVDTNRKEIVDHTAFIDSIRYLKLESKDEAIISSIQKILLDDENVYILDNLSKVSVFSKTGMLRYVIDNIGLGPGEYLKADNMTLNKEKSVLEILDIGSRKVSHYERMTGKFVDHHPLKEENFTYALFAIENNCYLSYLPLNVSSSGKFGVSLLDSTYNRIKTYLEYSGDYPLSGQDFGYISKIGTKKYGIFSPIESCIYHLDNLVLQKKILLRFNGKRTMEKCKGRTISSLSHEEITKIPMIFSYKETAGFIVFLTMDDQYTGVVVVYDKERQNSFSITDFADKSHPFASFIKSDTENILFGAFTVEQFNHMNMEYGDNKNINPQLLDLLKSSHEEDNPIIQIIYLKH